ncbi:rab-like protein 6 isoform X2 [Nematostella vectensis]|nr:rab-like protein 6 isoform X2 [Nematostella vectensis]
MPSGVKAMGQALQRKFARGVHYNMKIVIKGDRNTGKTCMFHRLHGKPFNEQYIPTNEIQVGSIQWSYRATDDVVKVDIWDIVDVGKSKKARDSLKFENDEDDDGNAVLDAGFVDVYKGTHGVLMLLDITKPWTFTYVRRELPKVPPHIPVLVLANRRDMEEHRLVDSEEITSFINSLERPDRSPPIHYAESSMKNGFGLKYIHTFLSFPFLMLQRETLLQQLQVNAVDMESTLEELQIHKESEEQDYDKFLSYLDRRKREREEAKAKEAAAAAASEAELAAGGTKTPNAGTPSSASSTAKPDSPQAAGAAPPASQGGGGGGLMKRWFSTSKPNVAATTEEVIPRQPSSSSANIEEFVPGDNLDSGFLDDRSAKQDKTNKTRKATVEKVDVAETPSESSDDSDSDSNPRNPMVAGFAEDLSSDEDRPAVPPIPNGNIKNDTSDRIMPNRSNPVKPVVADVVLTSSEEEEEEPAPAVTPIPKRSTPPSHNKPAALRLDTKGAQAASAKRATDEDDLGMDDWLNSPELEPQIPFASEPQYTVRKVDLDSPEPQHQPSSISVDEWAMFMSEQLSTSGKKHSTKEPKDDGSDSEKEAKVKRHKEHKSGEKPKSKSKHKKSKDKEEHKEKRRSRHKDNDSAKEHRKSRDEEGDKKKKSSKHKHSKRRGTESGPSEGVTYEEL